MTDLFIEAESFDNLGGWVVDSQSMEEIHSSYIMAHGLGIPVADAVTRITVRKTGKYSIWALTRDWTSVWNVEDSAGKFKITVDGSCLPTILGTNGPEWGWQKAGQIALDAGEHILGLRDITGFNGRIDAVYITESETEPSSDIADIDKMREKLSWMEISDAGEYDLVVAGGGIAGICTALSASRLGVRTCLIHDRSMLGGCNSSEVRVCLGGQINVGPYPRIGDVVKQIEPVMGDPNLFDATYYEDDRKRLAFEVREKRKAKCDLLFNERVTDVERDGDRITAVITTNTLTGKKKRIKAVLFTDATGDAFIARTMGCSVMYGREARDEFSESLAPEKPEKIVMGHSLRWYSEQKDRETSFPDFDWNLKIGEDTCFDVFDGDWEQETGFRRDMIHETEYIRDYGLRAIFSNWSFQKNRFSKKDKYANRSLVWVSPFGGKRESCRIVGEHILTQNDVDDRIIYDDAGACMSWSFDMHFPEPDNDDAFDEPFRSYAYHRGIVKPYPIPYRCTVAKGPENLFLAGRIVSCTHVAFSSLRVMRTLGALGEVTGMAAAVCKENECTPIEVYTKHLSALVEKMEKGVPCMDAFACTCGEEESYHFKDIGWLHLHDFYDKMYTCDTPERMDKFLRGIERMGLQHKNPYPPDMHFEKTGK